MWEQYTAKCLWLWMSPQQNSICGLGYVCAAVGIPLRGLLSKDKPMLQQVHLEVFVAMYEARHLEVVAVDK